MLSYPFFGRKGDKFFTNYIKNRFVLLIDLKGKVELRIL